MLWEAPLFLRKSCYGCYYKRRCHFKTHRHFAGSLVMGADICTEVMTRPGQEAPTFLRKLWHDRDRKRRHFYGSYDTTGLGNTPHFNGSYDTDGSGSAAIFTEVLERMWWEEAPPFLRKLCFACGAKRHFYGNGNIAQYITTTFNSPHWRPTRRPLSSSCDGCNDRGGCGVDNCPAW